jgi:hypothetical protein
VTSNGSHATTLTPVGAVVRGLVAGAAVRDHRRVLAARRNAVMPAAKLYKPIWEYDLRTPATDLSAHLVHGTTTAATLRLPSG